jgi:hypothetical protein
MNAAEGKGHPRPSATISDYEDFSQLALTSAQLAELVGEAGQCVFSWSTRDGSPLGVVMAYVYRDGSFWLNCTAHRKRIAALRARPNSGLVLNKDDRMATFKGQSIIHSAADGDWDQVKGWFYAALSGADRQPDDPVSLCLQRFLDGKNQVIIQVRASLVLSFDFGKFGAMTKAAIEASLATS